MGFLSRSLSGRLIARWRFQRLVQGEEEEIEDLMIRDPYTSRIRCDSPRAPLKSP